MSVVYETSGGRATITIDDEARMNPMSIETMSGLLDATRSAVADEDVRVIVYTGAGDRAFSAGGDLTGSFADDAVGLHRARGSLAELLRLMMRGGKPTVARVNGHALAGGFGLAVACDVTICVDTAKLGTSEIRVGLWPMMISAVLAATLPRKAALELMMTGRTITPDEALELGAVSRVVPAEELDDAVDDVVEVFLNSSSSTLMFGKDSFYSMVDADLDTALDRLQGGLTQLMLSADANEGVTAFIEKREPDWGSKDT